MKKLRVLVATLGAALAIGAFPAPAQATHRCANPPTDDPIVYFVVRACEYGYHHPVDFAQYAVCWLTPVC